MQGVLVMAKRSVEYLELQELLSSLCDGGLGEAEQQRLFEIVEADPAARRFYVDYMHLDASIRWQCTEPSDDELDGVPKLAPRQSAARIPGMLNTFGDYLGHGFSFLSKSNVFALLVALGLPGFVLVFLAIGLMTQSPPEGVVASVMRTHDCVGHLGDRHVPLSAGLDIYPGQRVAIEEGLVEIEFAHGARTILEAPTTFEIRGGNAGFLHEGRLAAKAPPSAHGFAIGTPMATVVDLGTDFGVSVESDGTAEAHVFEGEVEVFMKATPKASAVLMEKRLQAGQAVQVSLLKGAKTPRMIAMAAADSKFARHVPGTLAKPTIVFAHHGARDPVVEGWKKFGKENAKAGVTAGPVVEDGTAAWMFSGPKDKWIYYAIEKEQGLSQPLIDEARERGWVLRARIWISDESDVRRGLYNGLCRLSYGDGHQRWILHPTINRSGDQCAIICEDSSLGNDAEVPVPGSRNRYVDYEIRYVPKTDTADVYLNGRRVATGFVNKRDGTPGIHFGKWRGKSESRFSLVEWGILSEPPDTAENAENPGRKQ